jgi:hypothetical protein
MRTGKTAGALHHLDLALFGEHRKPADQLADHLVLPFEQLRQLDPWSTEVDAMRPHLADFVDDLGRVQQGLRGDAAHVEADAAQHGPALHQRDLETQVGSAERCGITAGTRTQDQQLSFTIVRHVGLEWLGRLGRGRGRGRSRRLLRHHHGCGSRGGRLRGGRRLHRRGRGLGRFHTFDARDHAALGDLAALLHQHLGDGAGRGGRHVHRGLVRFQRDQGGLDFDFVPHLDQDINNGDFIEIP